MFVPLHLRVWILTFPSGLKFKNLINSFNYWPAIHMISWKSSKKLWQPTKCTLFNTSQVASANSPHYMFAQAASAASLRLRGSAIRSDSEFKFSSTGGCTSSHQPHPPLSLSQFQVPTWIHLEFRVHTRGPSQVRHPSQVLRVHRRFACMGCTARRGEPTFFNDYQSAATHYSRSIHCNKSMRGIKAVTVQLHTRPQHVGDGVAGAGGAPGVWRPQPAPSRRAAGAMIS